MFQELTAFTVLVDYGRHHVTLNVHVNGGAVPVLRAHKETAYDSPGPYRAFEGPRLDGFMGYLRSDGAWWPDKALIGTVQRQERSYGPAEWIVCQENLGTLTGSPAGVVDRMKHTFPFTIIFENDLFDNFAYRVRFAGPGTPGFEITRTAGFRPSYKVRVDDPRVDRRLVLACVIEFAKNGSRDVRHLRALLAVKGSARAAREDAELKKR